ncbi:MAG: PTS sugar transporter subunit IIA [Phycisphaerales bacterium]|nr:PTS sugar transporter subunit IIA [Phycisphaerales bacterium]
MRLEPLLKPELVLVLEGLSDKESVLHALANAALGSLNGVDQTALERELAERERRYPTSTPDGVAFPHAMLPGIQNTVVVAALLRPGVSFGVESHPAADIVFGTFGCSEKPFGHVRLLARLARIARGPGALDRLRAVGDGAALFKQLVDEDRLHG